MGGALGLATPMCAGRSTGTNVPVDLPDTVIGKDGKQRAASKTRPIVDPAPPTDTNEFLVSCIDGFEVSTTHQVASDQPI